MIKVSVIIPCLDIKKSINGCLNSINNQKFIFLKARIEVICIIDGHSEDLKFLEKWEKDNKNNLNFELKICFLKKNRGAGYSRYTGFKICTGEFIAFLDDDDVWEETKIEKQLTWHLNNPEKIISSHLYCNGNDFVNQRMKGYGYITFNQLLIGGVRIATPTIMIRKSLWPYNPEKLRYCEDWLMVSMIAKKEKIKIIPEVLALRSRDVLPLKEDKLSLSNHKIRLRLGKVKAIFILFKREKISLIALILLVFWQFILFIKGIIKSFRGKLNIKNA